MPDSVKQDYGSIRVRTTTTRGALPVEGAQIYISESDPENNRTGVIASGLTDQSGLSEIFSLPAPPLENSQEPGGPLAYTRYNIEVIAEGYYPYEKFGVPVFPGILSIQGADLIPRLGEEHIFAAHGGMEAPTRRPEIMLREVDGTGVPRRTLGCFLHTHLGAGAV